MEKAKKVWDWYQSWFDAYPRGAAIELSMAKEIFAEVTTGKLIAANLGKPNQVMELADTLVAL